MTMPLSPGAGAGPLLLYTLSLNCAALLQPPSPLSSSLIPTLPSQPPHLLVLSLQELAPLPAALISPAYLRPFASSILSAALSAIEERYGLAYDLAAEHYIVGTGLMVLSHPKVEVRAVRRAAAGTGFGGWLGNKGAAAVRLEVEGAELTAVGVHLSPDEGQAARRDWEWGEVVRRCVFWSERERWRRQIVVAGGVVIVAGDLNYRASDVRISRTGRFKPRLEDEQLARRMAAGKTLQGFWEHQVAFEPTYKFSLSTGDDAYVDNRVPSWTDRILFAGSKRRVKVREYQALEGYRGWTDHKGVWAIVEVGAETEAGSLEEAMEDGRGREVDEWWWEKRMLARGAEVVIGVGWSAGWWGVVGMVVATILGGWVVLG